MKSKIWYHWVMERCVESLKPDGKCFRGNHSQGPIGEPAGEDMKLSETLREYRADQASGETDYRCDSCNSKLILVSRHAIADNNIIEDEDGTSYAVPLLEGQTRGVYQ